MIPRPPSSPPFPHPTPFRSCPPHEVEGEREGNDVPPWSHLHHRHARLPQLPCLQGSRGTPGGSYGEIRGVPGVIDTLRLTAEEATGLLERGEASPAQLHRPYLDAAADPNDDLN